MTILLTTALQRGLKISSCRCRKLPNLSVCDGTFQSSNCSSLVIASPKSPMHGRDRGRWSMCRLEEFKDQLVKLVRAKGTSIRRSHPWPGTLPFPMHKRAIKQRQGRLHNASSATMMAGESRPAIHF
ncbi:MAG: hypothetical protein KF861_16470 [Planctomycetaceae bacterium]|nr:hypothetical protein [Planctomycetaceae bacterium]